MDRLKQREKIHLVLKKLNKSLKDSPKMLLLKIMLWEIGHLFCSSHCSFFIFIGSFCFIRSVIFL